MPNKELGVSVATQAQFQAIDERIAWENPRVAAFSQYLLKDDPLGGRAGSSVHGGTVGFQTGLEYVNGKAKPLYYSFPIPLTVTQSGHGYSLWGMVTPTTGSTRVTVYVRRKGSRSFRALKTVTTNSLGYWSLRSSVAGQYWRSAGRARRASHTKGRRSPPTVSRPRRAPAPYDGSGCRSCPRLRSRRVCFTESCAASRSNTPVRRGSTR